MSAAGQGPLISVLTPVYNGEALLADCIESVLAQTYQNFEYIVVNNRSTDRTREIALGYAARDKRIQVHDNADFVNADANHNRALARISPQSRYCKFVQGDDKLFPECLERMVDLAEKHPKVGMVAAYGIYDAGKVLWEGLPLASTVVAGREVCRARFLGGPYLFGNPTSSLLRTEIVRGKEEFYPEWNPHSDTEICYRILQEWDFGFVHQILVYKKSATEGSITAWSRRINTFAPGHLHDLLTYGHVYLSREELEPVVAERMAFYYDFLAKSRWEDRDAEFWKYHEAALRRMGRPLDRKRLYAAMVRRLFKRLLPR